MHKSKKGFTIVELVIVIAVIAILAAVLIPTFSNLVKKANIAADISLTKNLNTILTTDAAIGGKNATAYDAVQAALENGYSVEKLSPTTEKHDILWDSTLDRFVLVNEAGEEVFPKDGKTSANLADLFKFYETVPALAEQNYSIYLRSAYDAASGEDVEVKVGFDAGTNRNVNVTFTSDATSNVIIRTDGGKLTVDGEDATINHYGASDIVDIVAVAQSSYHEHGAVRSMLVKKGRVVVESKGEVTVLDTTAATATVKVEAAANAVISNVVADSSNANVTLDTTVAEKKVEKVVVNSASDLQAKLNAGEKYIVFGGNITATTPIEVKNNVIIDGAGYTLTNTSRGICVTVSDVDVTISNLTVNVTANDGRGIQVNSEQSNVKVHIDNCQVIAKTYAINAANASQFEMIITDSDISGWSALNIWSNESAIRVVGGSLTGENIYSGDSNHFGVVVVEGDTTNTHRKHASSINIDLIGVELNAVATGDSTQSFVLFNQNAVSNNVTCVNCVFNADGTSAGGYIDDGTGNVLYIDGQITDCK